MRDLVLARNCCLARKLPGDAENGVGMNRSGRPTLKTTFYIALSVGFSGGQSISDD